MLRLALCGLGPLRLRGRVPSGRRGLSFRPWQSKYPLKLEEAHLLLGVFGGFTLGTREGLGAELLEVLTDGCL